MKAIFLFAAICGAALGGCRGCMIGENTGNECPCSCEKCIKGCHCCEDCKDCCGGKDCVKCPKK